MSSANSYVMEWRTPKSPMAMMKSPLPRSPIPKSPIPKSPVAYDKYKSRCAYGLLSFFHFRRSNSRKLISDRKHLHRHAVGNSYKRNRHRVLSDYDDRSKRTDQTKKRISTSKSHLNDLPRSNMKATKPSRRHHRLPIYGCYDVSTVGHGKPGNQVSVNMMNSMKQIDSLATVEVLPNQVHPTNKTNCNSKSINLQIQMDEATENFINQKLIDGEHSSNNQSKHFLDALQILNSNRDLFVRLLQDPNSLLVKHIEDLRDSQTKEQETKVFTEEKLSEEQTSDGRECKGSGDPQVLEEIVVLQPGSTSLQEGVGGIGHDSSLVPYSFAKVEQSARPVFFPFKVMRKLLMNAMGVSRKDDNVLHKLTYNVQGLEQWGERKGLENDGRNSLKKNSMDVKRLEQNKVKNLKAVVAEEVNLARERGNENSDLSITKQLKQNNYDVHVDSKKLSELLNKGNEKFVRKQRSKTWDGVGLAPEYDFLPIESPGRKREDGFVTQMKFSPHGSYQTSENGGRNLIEKEDNCLSPLRQLVEHLPMPDNENHHDQLQMPKKKPSISDSDTRPRDSMKPADANDSDISAEISLAVVSERNQNDDSSPENQVLPSSENHYPSSPLSIQRVENFDSITDKSGQPSPVSVLDQFFSAYITSPSRTEPEPAESSIISAEISPVVVSEMNQNDDSSQENQVLPSSENDHPSSPLSIRRVGNFDSITDKSEQPSPASVLDKFFREDTTTPSRTELEPAESSIMLLSVSMDGDCMASNAPSPVDMIVHLSSSAEENMKEDSLAVLAHASTDQKISSSSNVEEKASICEYISSMLYASGLNWDELLLKCHLLDQFLDQTLFPEVDECSKQFCGDHGLLFDYIGEVLLEVYQCYLRHFPWLQLTKPKNPSIAMARNIVQEVMKHIDWNLLLSKPTSQTLDQLVEKDLRRSRTWMDIQNDAEGVISLVVESVVEDIITETAMEWPN